MRTEARVGWVMGLVVGLLAPPVGAQEEPGALAAERFAVGVGVEANVVGLAMGLHPELVYRPFERGSASRLRLSAGLLANRQYLNVPLSLGYRAHWREGSLLQPLLGAGVHMQGFFIPEARSEYSGGLYIETGLGLGVAPWLQAGVLARLEPSFFPNFGLGLAARAFVLFPLGLP